MRNVLAAFVWLVAAAAPAKIIDRILAVVDGAIIMQSDVAVAVRLSMVPAASGADPIPAALDALIERRLILEEVDRYAPPDPADADIDRQTIARLGAYLRLSYTDAGKPYGDTKDGFNQWLAELWPTPSAA